MLIRYRFFEVAISSADFYVCVPFLGEIYASSDFGVTVSDWSEVKRSKRPKPFSLAFGDLATRACL